MNLSIVSNVLLILVAVGVIAVRQMTWRPVLGGRDWTFPGLAAVVGAALLLQSLNGRALGVIDVVAFLVEVAIALGVGLGMGAIAHIRPIARPAGYAADASALSGKAAARALAEFETRTGPWGLALWIVLIGVRVGLTFAFESLGSHLGVSTGMILLVLAANRAARILVLHNRVEGLRRTDAQGASARIMVS
ncbi:hypothetical protein ACIPY5_19305 [Microbacterium sp. NPDC089698]|jgi:hypothetical protein|uniref:hypothetical protein n=1 Tax=unclassified Microbacterium TaxID=2609290 RepID=UPI00281B1B64|nr:hypothetical protein [Microbacterium sp.]MDR2321369.1 hypothetical protein [Microbacterium sp.]